MRWSLIVALCRRVVNGSERCVVEILRGNGWKERELLEKSIRRGRCDDSVGIGCRGEIAECARKASWSDVA